MSAWVWVILAVVGALSVSIARGLVKAHGRGERYEPRHLPRPVPEVHHERDFYGSMSMADDRVWADRKAGRFDSALGGPGSAHPLSGGPGPSTLAFLPADPIPYEDLQSDERIEAGPDWREQTAADLSPAALDPGPGVEAVVPVDPPPGPVQDLDGSAGDPGRLLAPLEVPFEAAPVQPSRLADTDEIAEARGWPTTRDQDADVKDWLAGRAIQWARLEIGALT